MGESATSNQRSVLSALILAGGSSKRMNYPKPWLLFRGNTTFLETIIATYHKSGIRDINVVINSSFCTGKWSSLLAKVEKNVRVIANAEPARGRLNSIRLGLEKIRKADHIYIHNVDNPFVDSDLISELARNYCPNGSTIPRYQNGGGHPVLISKRVRRSILENEKDELTLRDILNQHDKKYVAVSSDTVKININTPADYQHAIHGLD